MSSLPRDTPYIVTVEVKRLNAKIRKVIEHISSSYALTWQRIIVSTSNLVEIVNVGGESCNSRSVSQINRKWKYDGLSLEDSSVNLQLNEC